MRIMGPSVAAQVPAVRAAVFEEAAVEELSPTLAGVLLVPAFSIWAGLGAPPSA